MLIQTLALVKMFVLLAALFVLEKIHALAPVGMVQI